MEEYIFKKTLSKMCTYCARAEKCEFDIKQKLLKYEISENNIEEIIIYLKTNNYIDNKRYAIAFANDKLKYNKWGRYKIKQHLKQKQLNINIISEALKTLNLDEYNTILLNLLKNKRKQIKDVEKVKIQYKLLNYAVSKGFEQNIIYNMILDNGLLSNIN